MRKLTLDVDETTYAGWEQRAAARGLSVEEWLKRKVEPTRVNGHPAEELTPEERVARLQDFWSTLKGRGGTADVDRENIYG